MKSFREHLKETTILAYPVVLGQLGYSLMGVIDSAMVGRVGATELAASAVGNGIFFLTLVLGLGVSYAVTPLVAIAIGAKDTEKCSNLFKQSLVLNFITGIILFFLNIYFSNYMHLLGQPEEVTLLAIPYTRILGISIIPIMIFQSYKQFIEGLSIVRPAMFMVFAANIINVCFNLVLIYGNLGFPALGLNGAGISTVIARTSMALLLFAFVNKASRFKSYKLNPFPIRFDLGICKKLLKVGVPSGLQYFFEVGAFTFAALMVGWISVNDLAAHQVVISLAGMSYMVVLGISTSSSIRVGNYVGGKNIRETRRAGYSGLLLASSFMALCAIIFIVTRRILPHFFIHDEEVVRISAGLMLVAGFFQLFDGIQAVGLGILRGLTDVYVPTIITFAAYWILALPLGWLFGFLLKYGVNGVWFGLLLGLAFSAFFLTVRFNIISKNTIKI